MKNSMSIIIRYFFLDKSETSQVIPSGLIRQESKLMENLRQIEEEQALPKWERIIRYCIGVSCF